ncbi:MAG: HAMP domain-containing histidine kinase [Planctomycetes bacterium]|nr:HAMP domain-containing histidine kinase [Planctomycetota bacterium]
MRPRLAWLIFALVVLVLLAAAAGITTSLLRLDRAEAEAQRAADVNEDLRAALWRMESALAPVIAQEAGRPYFVYDAFVPPSRSYNRMFEEIEPGDILVPSPLITFRSPYVRIHFQVAPGDEATSPQAPVGNMRDVAEARGICSSPDVEKAHERLARLAGLLDPAALVAALPPAPAAGGEAPAPRVELLFAPREAQPPRQAANPPGGRKDAQWQQTRNVDDYSRRAQTQQQTVFDQTLAQGVNGVAPLLPPSPGEEAARPGIMTPLWVGAELVLARRVMIGGREIVQGAWLDWPAIRAFLLAEVRDQFPNADLLPVAPAAGRPPPDHAHLLASLPARLATGPIPPPPDEPISAPTRLTLLLSWGALLFAGVCLALVLAGALALSERRAAFVSAVTHELRTPLTSLRMYAEMLAGGMVAGEAQRGAYHETLLREAERLSRLVENVLSWARLERGRAPKRGQTLAVGALLDAALPRLVDRAAQSGMTLAADRAATACDVSVRADPDAVEQILFNLVDNACKYAAGAADKTISLTVTREPRRALITLRDAGPGIAPAAGRRLFTPFRKSAGEAANSAPGVGLGLALCRRLARQMGGDLHLAPPAPGAGGACFCLTLPVAPAGRGAAAPSAAPVRAS